MISETMPPAPTTGTGKRGKMRSDAFIVVTCDKCGCEIEIQLTAVARGYDERNVDGELDQAGWTTDSGDLCEDCSAASKESVHQ